MHPQVLSLSSSFTVLLPKSFYTGNTNSLDVQLLRFRMTKRRERKGIKKAKVKPVFPLLCCRDYNLSCGFIDGKKSADKKGKKAPEVLDEDAPPPPPAPLEVHMSIK